MLYVQHWSFKTGYHQKGAEKFLGGGSNNVYGYSTTKIQGEGVIGGEICFGNQLAFNSWQELYNYTDEFKEKHIQFGAYYMPPQEGTMLFFPAHLRHHVEPNKSDEDRISCSFNLDLVQDYFLRQTSLINRLEQVLTH